jgi:hypothetical protein
VLLQHLFGDQAPKPAPYPPVAQAHQAAGDAESPLTITRVP